MSPARKASTPEEPDDLAQETAEDAVPGAVDGEPETGAEVEEVEDEAAVEDEAEDVAAVRDETEAAEPEPEPAKPARRRTAAKATADAEQDAGEPEAEEPPAKAPARAARAARAQAASKPKRKAPVAGFSLVEADLPADIFDVQVNVPLIHQVVVAQQAAARQGTASTKTRGEVRGGGRKPYRQKGTGRARQGSTRAPQFAGGGTVHGPVPRSFAQKTPKKMKAAALRGALSDRARHGLVQVVEGFVEGSEPKTRDALAVLNLATVGDSATRGGRNVLVVAETSDQVTWKSLRNAVGVHLIDPGQLNTYDVLVSDRVVFTTSALASFVARAGRAASRDREDARL